MSHRKRKNKSHLRWRSVFLWHRYMGLCSALFVVMLAITGILLNHTEELSLDSKHIKSTTLLDWYGMRPATPPVSYVVDDQWLSELGGELYFNDQPLAVKTPRLLGVVSHQEILIVALADQLLMLTDEGELIEKIDSVHGVPSEIQKIGQDSEGQLILNTRNGNYLTDSAFLEWQAYTTDQPIEWALPQNLPDSLLEKLLTTFRGNGLTLERVILDTHSGRILGKWGVYLMDTVAVVFIFLAAAGIWVWAKRKH